MGKGYNSSGKRSLCWDDEADECSVFSCHNILGVPEEYVHETVCWRYLNKNFVGSL